MKNRKQGNVLSRPVLSAVGGAGRLRGHREDHRSKSDGQTTATEETLRESEKRYRTLFDLFPMGIYFCDASGVIQKFNRRAAELWGREPAIGETGEQYCGSYKLFRSDGRFIPREQCPMGDVVRGKIPAVHNLEELVERPDGSQIYA